MRFYGSAIRCSHTGRGMALMAALCGATGIATPASAHHSFGMFDMQKTVSVQGTVKDFQWENPHVWIDLLSGGAGQPQQPVSVEADAVAIMKRRGFARDSMKPGDKVTLVVHPLKTGQIGGSLVSAVVNGQPLGRAGPP